MMHKKPYRQENTKRKKWITLTYYSPLRKKKINLFKHTNLSIAYQATNMLYNRLQNTREVQNKFQKMVPINSHTEYVMSHTWDQHIRLETRFSEHQRYVLSISLTMKINRCHVNVIHMHITAICIHFSTIAFCPCLTGFSVCNDSLIFLCFSCYTVVCPVCIKHHPCTCLGNSFLILNIYIIF